MMNEIKKEETSLTPLIITLLVIAGLLFLFAPFAPYLFTKTSTESVNFSNTGEIGDTIGGLMSPFINLSAVIVTGLAFYMQYRANKLQVSIFEAQLEETRKQFAKEQDNLKDQMLLQQFESQFFEMIRLHKENVNELSIKGLINGEQVNGRQVFKTMAEEFNLLLSYAAFEQDPMLSQEFESAYEIFFWGYDENVTANLSTPSQNFIGGKDIHGSGPVVSFSSYQGQSASLGHYFRHLFMMVKFVVDSKIVEDYDQKMKYLKMLRAQLSNYEQIMLFYNWISGYGGNWENQNNNFFTEYCMIHNLWKKELFQNKYILEKINDLENKPVKSRVKPLFEYQEK